VERVKVDVYHCSATVDRERGSWNSG